MAADDFSIIPDSVSQLAFRARVLTAQFGDNYNQRAADGLNAVEETWSLVWLNLEEADAQTLEALFVSKGGYSVILWTEPRSSTQKKWLCKEWSRENPGGLFYNLKATFTRVFDL